MLQTSFCSRQQMKTWRLFRLFLYQLAPQPQLVWFCRDVHLLSCRFAWQQTFKPLLKSMIQLPIRLTTLRCPVKRQWRHESSRNKTEKSLQPVAITWQGTLSIIQPFSCHFSLNFTLFSFVNNICYSRKAPCGPLHLKEHYIDMTSCANNIMSLALLYVLIHMETSSHLLCLLLFTFLPRLFAATGARHWMNSTGPATTSKQRIRKDSSS